MTKEETIQVLQSIEDRAIDFPNMTECDWVAIAAAKRHLTEKPINDDLEEAAKNHAAERYRTTRDRELAEKCKWSFKAGAQWKEKKDKQPISDDLSAEIDYLSKRYPEVSFAKLTRIAVHVANWQMQQIFKVKEDVKLWARDYEDDFEDEFSKVLAERKEMLPKNEEKFSDLDLYRIALHFNGWKEHQMMKDFWHDASEEPELNSTIVIEWASDKHISIAEFKGYVSYSKNRFRVQSDLGYGEISVSKWCYLDDILPDSK